MPNHVINEIRVHGANPQEIEPLVKWRRFHGAPWSRRTC